MPLTPSIIKQVHKLTELDNMPKGLKITNKTGDIFFDSTQIAGVDYDADKFSDQDCTSESESDSNDHSDDDNDEEGDKIDQN
eukprot:8334249-Ditylum_brightwellii.AAC.1